MKVGSESGGDGAEGMNTASWEEWHTRLRSRKDPDGKFGAT